MVLLNLKTDNDSNIILAKFDSVFNQSYIQFSNINSNIFISGLSNNHYKIVNANNNDDLGLRYSNNFLNVKNIDSIFIKNNSLTFFPNEYTPINDYVITEPSAITGFESSRCFDLNDGTYWQSENVYSSIDGMARTDLISHKFQDSFGHYIKIRFPYLIIPIGFSVLVSDNYYNPLDYVFYASKDDINWVKLFVVNNNLSTTKFSFNYNTTLYKYIVLVITKIKQNISVSGYQSFILYELKITTKPILNIDNNLKVSNNNIYNLETINTKQIVLNDIPISSLQELNSAAIGSAISAFRNEFAIFWKASNLTGYLDNSIAKRIAINKSYTSNFLEIAGDISYINRTLNTKLIVSTIGNSYNSSYIFIGKINLKSLTNKHFFHLAIYLNDITKYYFQFINIYTYSYIDINTNNNQINSFKLYWDTSFDDTNAIQRIVDIVYIIDFGIEPVIRLYMKYNDSLDITFSQQITGIRDLFTNHIYFDEIHSSDEIIFIPPSTIETLSITNFIKGINITTNNLNKQITFSSSNVINNLTITNNLILSNINIKSNNILILNSNRNLIDTGINFIALSNLNNYSLNQNKIACFDNSGIITSINVSRNLLSNINFISSTNSMTLITNNGIFEPFFINKSILNNLNSINNIPNSLLYINNNLELKNTSTININSLTNLLNLYNFNQLNSYNHTRINLNLNSDSLSLNSNLYIGSLNISSNNLNRLTMNSRIIGDDVIRTIMRIPTNNNDRVLTSIDNFTSGIKRYDVSLLSGLTITLEVNPNDDIGSDVSKQAHNLMRKSAIQNWQTQSVFLDYRSDAKTAISKNVYDDNFNKFTLCGAYVVINIYQPFILQFYSIYVNYTDVKTTMRDFNLFGYNNFTSTWTLLDTQRNIVLNNNMIANNFFINKNNYAIYNRYALCILANNNTSVNIPNACITNSIEFFGYMPNNNTYNYSNFNVNYTNNPILLGNTNIGINNFNPAVNLSIGNDLVFNNNTESILNINHNSLTTNNIEKPIIHLTRPSNNNTGIRATHYLNDWFSSNTTYTIKLTHNNIENERVVLSMNSDGRIGIGSYINTNHSFNGLSIYGINNGLSFYGTNNNFINIRPPTNLNNANYSLILPPSTANYPNVLCINNFNSTDKTISLNWSNPADLITTRFYHKIGDQSIFTRNDVGLALQVAGKCLIGTDNIQSSSLTSKINDNNLIVVGKIYATIDINTDSDISHKYDIKHITNSLDIIRKINGYTFKRNDMYDDEPNRRYTGLIAQEVQNVMPELIDIKHDGKLRLLYTNMAGLFIEGIKDLEQKNKNLERKVNLLILSSISLSIGLLIITKSYYIFH